MTLRERMLRAARRGAERLEAQRDLARAFVVAAQQPDGAFVDRSGQGDLYFTVFGLSAAQALSANADTTAAVRLCETLGDGADLDFVHLCCLIRCRALLNMPTDDDVADTLHAMVQRHVSGDGGFAPQADSARATMFATFLGTAAVQDLARPIEADAVAAAVTGLLGPAGGMTNDPCGIETTPTTAAAVTLLANLGWAVPESAIEWLQARRCSGGGFAAAALLPVADVLSTAVARHALVEAGHPPSETQEYADLAFVSACWLPTGGYGSMPGDAQGDVEYLFYALLSLGATGGDDGDVP